MPTERTQVDATGFPELENITESSGTQGDRGRARALQVVGQLVPLQQRGRVEVALAARALEGLHVGVRRPCF